MPILYPSILAIDVGLKTSGFANIDKTGDEAGHFQTKSFKNFYTTVKYLVDFYKANLVVVGKPNRFYNVIAGQSKLIGIACLIAEKKTIPLIELNDSTVRAKLFPGKGNAKKEKIKADHFPDMQDDAMDALVLARGTWQLFNTLEGD